MPQPSSTRWSPTAKQLMILEEMYRSGLRTPNASQIQQITAHLSFHGKIEGKNVFYWFQNHKARERQKLRRLTNHQQQQQQQQQFEAALCWVPDNYLTTFPILPHSTPQFNQKTPQIMNLVCKLETSGSEEMETRVLAGGRDSMMMEMGSTSCCSRPLKTLELFPVRSTGLKEEMSNSSTPFLSSTSGN